MPLAFNPRTLYMLHMHTYMHIDIFVLLLPSLTSLIMLAYSRNPELLVVVVVLA